MLSQNCQQFDCLMKSWPDCIDILWSYGATLWGIWLFHLNSYTPTFQGFHHLPCFTIKNCIPSTLMFTMNHSQSWVGRYTHIFTSQTDVVASWFNTHTCNTILHTTPLGPLLLTCLTLIPAWKSNYIHYKLWDEITHPFLNFNGCTVEV